MIDTAPGQNHDSLVNRLPTQEEIDSASRAAAAIAVALKSDGGLKIRGENGDSVKIAPAVGELVTQVLDHVSNGNMMTLVPDRTVKRPGGHRYVPLTSLTEYRDQKALRQEQAMRYLAGSGQDFDQG